jgi:hypothetical protein
MSQVVVRSPLDELELPHQFGPQPTTVFHPVSCGSLAPTTRPSLREIGERAFRNLQRCKLRRELGARLRREPASRATCIQKPVVVEIPEDDRIEVRQTVYPPTTNLDRD